MPSPVPPSPQDPSRLPERAQLAVMVAAQKQLLQQLWLDPQADGEFRKAHEATLRFLEAQLQVQLESEDDSRPAQLQKAAALADVLIFEVPGSHRAAAMGKVVTGAKRAVMRGLAPFHAELLRTQRRFNIELVRLLRELFADAGKASAQQIGRRLGPFVDPTERSLETHRSGAVGRLVGAAKRGYLRALSPVLTQLLGTQRAWNEQVLAFLTACMTEWPSRAEAYARLTSLAAQADPLASPSASMRALEPLWREVFRRQTTFNRVSMELLANLTRVHVPPGPRAPDEYARWCSGMEPTQIRASLEAARALETPPLLSVITPVFDTPEAILRACLDSVLSQPYPRIELCVADDGSSAPHVARVLAEYARRDSRVKHIRLPRNGGIAVATNAALGLATGDFVCFLDHDDTLAPHALGQVALTLARHPESDVLYSDEDRLDEGGQRVLPFFKPDWSPDLLHAVNYVCHFLVMRRALVEQLERVRMGLDGAQDYDLILRASEQTKAIRHIPAVLYHARITPQSTAQNVRNKAGAGEAGLRALREHLARTGVTDAQVEEFAPTNYRVRWPVRGQPLVSIIVPFKDKPELLRTLTRSLLEHTRGVEFELLLISNNSTQPETFAVLNSLQDPRIRRFTWDHPFNWSAINNWAAQHARGELLCFLNNDIELVDDGWLEELVSQAQRPEVGVVGPKLLFPDGTLQHAGVVLGIQGYAGHPFVGLPEQAYTAFGSASWPRDYLAVTGACLMVRREVFDEVGRFDESFVVCGSDVELGLRVVRSGRRVLYTPFARLIHDESATRRTDHIPEGDFWRSFATYAPYLRDGDPFFNPNLSLHTTDGSLRTDSRTAESLALDHLSTALPGSRLSGADRGQIERARHVIKHLDALDYNSEQAQAFRERTAHPARSAEPIRRMTWFVPYFFHPYGGVHTILRFGSLLRARHGVEPRFVVYDNPSASVRELEARATSLYPDLRGTFEVTRSQDALQHLSPVDVAVATQWTSAYALMRATPARLSAYFVQDCEPLFYPAGTFYGLAEQTYRLGLYGIFNTQGLHDSITQSYPMRGTWFEPTVDQDVFHDGRPVRQNGPVRIFFYGRPSTDRNAFELGLASLARLKRQLGVQVEIVTAGEPWNEEAYGVRGVVQNLGVLTYEQTGDLYRSCDLGLVFMFTKHPSYLPLEMMACGVTVVTNDNPANRWLLIHQQNCLLAEPTVSCVVEQLQRGVQDVALRQRVGRDAAARVTRSSWDDAVDKIYGSLLSALGQR